MARSSTPAGSCRGWWGPATRTQGTPGRTAWTGTIGRTGGSGSSTYWEIEKPEKGIPAITTSKLLYHGTSAHQLERLKASGWNAGLIYLSSNPDEANGYADRKVEQDEMDDGVDPEDNDSVMLSLNLDILERTGELMPDWDDMQSAWSLGEIDRPPDQVSWSESLDFGNTCSYTGPLEEAIVKVERWS